MVVGDAGPPTRCATAIDPAGTRRDDRARALHLAFGRSKAAKTSTVTATTKTKTPWLRIRIRIRIRIRVLEHRRANPRTATVPAPPWSRMGIHVHFLVRLRKILGLSAFLSDRSMALSQSVVAASDVLKVLSHAIPTSESESESESATRRKIARTMPNRMEPT